MTGLVQKSPASVRAVLYLILIAILCAMTMLVFRIFGIMDRDYYMARSACFRYDPILIYWHAITDFAIGYAYFTLPFFGVIFYHYEMLVRRGQDPSKAAQLSLFVLGLVKSKQQMLWGKRISHMSVHWLGFIFFCGAGHFIDSITVWVAAPWAKAIVNTGTAITSWSAIYVTAGHLPHFIEVFRGVRETLRSNPETT